MVEKRSATKRKTISIVIPCLNEAETLGGSLRAILTETKKFKEYGYHYQIIVVDNGSNDGSYMIAKKMKVTTIRESNRGYGSALRAGFARASGDYVVMVDCDNSYDYSKMSSFIPYFEQGYDFILGSRFLGRIERGAMPWLNRYIGNPLLTFWINLLFGCHISDSQTGMRGMTRECLNKCTFVSSGMEFASEMIIEMINHGAKLGQFPIDYRCRMGKSKLNPMLDGLRHMGLIFRKYALGK